MAYQPKSYRKFVATAATATLVATAFAPFASAHSFNDVEEKYNEAVDFLVSKGVTGYTDGTFKTQKTITRLEAAEMLGKALGLTEVKDAPASGFTDVPARVATLINAFKAEGITTGKTETTFGSNDEITRGELAIWLQRAYELEAKEGSTNQFGDVADRYKEAVQALVDNEITQGTSETTFGTTDNAKRGDFALFVKRAADAATPVEVAPAVESVGAINGKEFVVEFNTPVDSVSATDPSKYTLNGDTIGTPELSEDGKKVTITTSSVIDVENATLEISPIQAKDDTEKFTAKYVTLFTYEDTVAPTVAKVDAKDGKAVITFDEELNGTPGVSVNGVNYTSLVVSGKTLTINGLTDETSYSVELVGAKDAAGNIAHPISLGFTVGKPDAVQPQAVSTSFNENKVTLSFVNALSTESVAKVVFEDGKAYNTAETALELNGTDATGVKYSDDKKTAIIDVQAIGVLEGINFLTTDIIVSEAGLEKAVTTNATLTSDKTAATLVASQTTAAGKLVLEFNEDVENPSTLDLKVTTVDGIYQSTPIAWDNLSVAYAKDAKGDDITNKLEVTLPDNVVVGTNYTVEVPAAVNDSYNNVTTKFSVSVVKPTTDDTYKPGAVITAESIVSKNVIKLSFGATKDDKGVTSSALSASNYTLAGKALPTGTILRYVDNKQNVEIVLPEGAIKTTGDYVLTLSNIKDEAGNTLVAGEEKQTVSLVENVAPLASALTLKSSSEAIVTFSETVTFKDLDNDTEPTIEGITVKVNGKLVDVNIVPTDLAGTTLTIKGLDLKTTDSVTVEFKSAEIVDASANENTVKDGVVSK